MALVVWLWKNRSGPTLFPRLRSDVRSHRATEDPRHPRAPSRKEGDTEVKGRQSPEVPGGKKTSSSSLACPPPPGNGEAANPVSPRPPRTAARGAPPKECDREKPGGTAGPGHPGERRLYGFQFSPR